MFPLKTELLATSKWCFYSTLSPCTVQYTSHQTPQLVHNQAYTCEQTELVQEAQTELLQNNQT